MLMVTMWAIWKLSTVKAGAIKINHCDLNS